MDKVNILLVDDQPGKLLSYEAILGALGENLVLAKSGKEALQFLLANECALILLDVVMPEMDGFETATMIRQRPRLERTPIIFVTAYSTSDIDRLKGYELGAVDYVFAPIIPEILRAKASVFVELYRKRQALAVANEQLRNEIVERKKAEEHALQAERMAAVGNMVTGLAHESRNALQQIQASVEMLRRRIKTDSELGIVGEIQKAHDRVLCLLEEVRRYTAPVKLNVDTHNLAEIWQEAWRQLAAENKNRALSLREDTSQMDLRCEVDSVLVEQLFRSLFENSLAACRDPVKIEVKCLPAELSGQSVVRVRISDNSCGLTPEQRGRFFEPFFTTKPRGTGLAMAIAKRVVDAHRGQISLADEVNGSGTAIDLVLPRGRI